MNRHAAIIGLGSAALLGLAITVAVAALQADDAPPEASAPAIDSRAASATPEATARPITMADRRQALAEAAQCIHVKGFTVTVHYGEGLRLGGIELVASDGEESPGPEAAAAADAAVQECLKLHYQPVGQGWAAQQTELSRGEIEALGRRLEECVEAGGLPGTQSTFGVQYVEYANSPTTPVSIAPEDLRKYSECAIDEERRTGLKAPYPWPGFTVQDAVQYDSRPRGAAEE